MERLGGRQDDQIRAVSLEKNFVATADGSVLITMGKTKVICTASIQDGVPSWMQGQGRGWVTAEYNMLPGSTSTRHRRERFRISGRTQEIQRLIGRSLRAVVDFTGLGERTVICDCDVLQADGGTRTASITGAFVALAIALQGLVDKGELEALPIKTYCAAISVGVVKNQTLLDLCYVEDSAAEVDMNIVMNNEGEFIEVQGTAEGQTFSQLQLMQMLEYADKGIRELIGVQKEMVRL